MWRYGFALLLWVPTSEALAQTPPRVQPELNQLRLSSRLRIQTGTYRPEGRLVFRTADSVGIHSTEKDIRLGLTSVDSVWVRHSRTRLGFLIGTLVGGAAYVVTTAALSESSSDGIPELDNLIGGTLWVGSALLGTVVGGLSTHWKRVYPR